MTEIAQEIKDLNPVLPEDWETREADYLKQIDNLKKLNEKLINYSEEKSKKFEHDLQKLTNEKEIVQKRLAKMELDELRESVTGSSTSTKNIEAFKEKYDGILRRAQDLLFEKTKLTKSLELKVEAQHIQVRLATLQLCLVLQYTYFF